MNMKIEVSMILLVLTASCLAAPKRGGDFVLIDGQGTRLSVMSCKMPDGSALAYFRTNDVTEIRYVRFPSYIGVADAKPVKILSVRGLSPKDDAGTLALLDKADIGSWKTFYEDDRVSDGMHWTVEVVSGDKVVKRIIGFNAEPPGLKYLLKAGGVLRRQDGDRDF